MIENKKAVKKMFAQAPSGLTPKKFYTLIDLLFEREIMQWKNDSVELVAGTHNISFSSPFENGVEFTLQRTTMNADGIQVYNKVVDGSVSDSGFSIIVKAPCILTYLAIQKR